MNLKKRENFVQEARPIHEKFQMDAAHPEAAFEETWQEIHKKITRSSFWKDRLKDHLKDNAITDYDDYRLVLQQALSGNVSPLNGEKVLNWTLSSGSSGPSKYFPVTETYKRQVDAQHLCFIYEYLRRFPKFLNEPIHYLSASGPTEYNAAGVGVSYISNFNYRNLPLSLRANFGVPESIFQNESDLARWRPVYMLSQDCSAIIAGAPAAVISIFEQIKTNGKEFYDYLVGNLPWPSHLPPLPMTEERKGILAASGLAEGKPLFHKIWPGLQFIACWTSGICSMQAKFLRTFFETEMSVIAFPFASTEAWMTVCLSNSYSAGAINPRAALVEFSSLDCKIENKEAQVLLRPWELEVGKKYEMYITNLMGLVRYRIQDVVECVGHYKKVAEIAFLRKASQEISLAGTTFNESQFIEAIDAVPELRGVGLFFAPNAQGRGLTLYVASESAIDGTMTQKVEAQLFKINAVYQDDVKTGFLQSLNAKAVSPKNKIWQIAHSQAKLYIIRQTAPDL